jgi:glycosyltransferase involved in cell wall biosynthesis
MSAGGGSSGSGALNVAVVIEDLGESGAPWNYAKTLPEKLAAIDGVRPVVVFRRGDGDQFGRGVETVQLTDRSFPTRLLPDRPLPARLAAVERRLDIDLFHLNEIPAVGHLAALESDAPVVATVHGTLHWETIPVAAQERGYRVRRRLFDRLGRYTLDRLLTVSDYVTRTMVDRAGYQPGQVTTTHEAIDDSFFTMPASDGPDDAPAEYLLHVSNAAPKKNVETLLAAFSRLRSAAPDLELLVAGDRWHPQGPQLAAEHGVADSVQFLGYVSQERLVRLYDGAACFVYPSYHETFGLPNVEAMARGTPVVTTDAYAIPEIVGDAAVTVNDAGDPTALAEAIESVLGDEQRRERLGTRGRERATAFTWERHSERLVKTYRDVVAME